MTSFQASTSASTSTSSMTSSKELPPPPPYDAAQYYSSALLKAQRPFAHQSSSHAHHTSATPNPKFTEPEIFEPEKDVPVTSAGVFANVMEYEVYSGKPPHLSAADLHLDFSVPPPPLRPPTFDSSALGLRFEPPAPRSPWSGSVQPGHLPAHLRHQSRPRYRDVL